MSTKYVPQPPFTISYFDEIEQLKNRIKELEQKLKEEREEHREIYSKMKEEVNQNQYNQYNLITSNILTYEYLVERNRMLSWRNMELEELLEQQKIK